MKKVIALAAVVVSLISSQSRAEVYRCKNSKGKPIGSSDQ